MDEAFWFLRSTGPSKYDGIGFNAGKSIIIKEALANGRIFKNKDYGHYADLVRFLESLAVRYGVSIDAIGLRFVMDILEPALVLSGASTQRQLAENLRAQYFKLDLQDQLHLKQFAVDSEFYWNERKNLKWH